MHLNSQVALFVELIMSALGFEPAMKTEPSGSSVALEWYRRPIVELGRLVSNFDPEGAEAL